MDCKKCREPMTIIDFKYPFHEKYGGSCQEGCKCMRKPVYKCIKCGKILYVNDGSYSDDDNRCGMFD